MHLKSTLYRYYAYSFLGGLRFGDNVWLAYVLAHGGNPGWAESAYHLAILLGEIPTGVVADLMGRRISMLVGVLLEVITPLGYFLIHDTFTACLVLGVQGLSRTFLSGADTSLAYETAVALGGPELGRKVLSRSSALQLAAFALAPLSAGFLYQWHDWAPFVARAVVSLITGLVVWGMREQRQEQSAQRVGMWEQTRLAAGAVLSNRSALILVIFFWGFYTASSLVGQFGQAYFPAVGLSMGAMGTVYFVARLLSTGSSALSDRLSHGAAAWVLRVVPLGIALGYLGMGLSPGWIGVAFYFLSDALDGLLDPVARARFNEEIPSAQRATILSLQSTGVSLLMTITFPAASYLDPVHRIYLVVGVVSTALAGVWLVRRRA